MKVCQFLPSTNKEVDIPSDKLINSSIIDCTISQISLTIRDLKGLLKLVALIAHLLVDFGKLTNTPFAEKYNSIR